MLSFQARLFFHCPKFGILDECTKYVAYSFLMFSFPFFTNKCTALIKHTHCSATSVDVEEHLYKIATSMGITVITSSQVSII